MTAKVYSSLSSEVLPWRDAEALAPMIGEKAARLLCLPREWCPAFAALSHDAVTLLLHASADERDAFLEAEVSPLARKLLRESGEIIVRSSIVAETIWDRGTYESVVIRATPDEDLANQLVRAVSRVHASAIEEKCAVVIQVHMPQSEMGEFGNLLRISRTRDHWELSVRTADGVTRIDRFNSQRDVAPDPRKALLPRVGLQRERFFGSVAAWINNELMRGLRTRVNCEWVRNNDRFYIVQIDAEDEDLDGINPMQLFVEQSITATPKIGALLKPADAASQKNWDKLAVLEQLFDSHPSTTPALFYVCLKDLKVNAAKELLVKDFSDLLQKNIVVRTSVRTGREKITNLPKTDCMTAEEAATWCCEKAAQLSSEHPQDDLAFIAHRYIASRASAWVRATPGEPIVEVHGTWGLPDALQFCPYDIWEVHAPTEDVTEYTNYKSDILLLQDDGSWKYERVKNDVARYQSIIRSEVVEIARRSRDLANKLACSCHIMWFVGCVSDDGTVSNVPWYWTKAHDTENPERGNHQILVIEKEDDLSRVAAMKAKYRKLAISLRPSSVELLRDNTFLAKVSDVVRPLNVPVVLSGSTLAHAFYQLRKNGCVVIPEFDKDHQRTRRHANFGKLVRDKIPEKIASQGEQQSVATIPQSARKAFLIGKIIEEVLEAREADNEKDRLVELADIYEVLRAIVSASGEKLDDVILAADKKRKRAGGFDDGKLLVATSLPRTGEELISRASVTSADLVGELSSDYVYRIPFAFFGFSELGYQRALQFPEFNIDIQIVLQKDCLELSLRRWPEQLSLF
ncbi:nucleoside triphosphate pyrophosphohydrolase [Kaistia defluvii]|uniref:nucleoside triphosphate pyrophosphohydrolase n=1 Tax=Kaistia defluvii TaxID=410841 RepID=UPI0022511329|nr:nucleoside triphosphate pyrophosphohydrolase [Kaistia defluvii]MCX5518069.1 nucleoside triphosphate pyrophosphohydrolase [Kaistia defluvii]